MVMNLIYHKLITRGIVNENRGRLITLLKSGFLVLNVSAQTSTTCSAFCAALMTSGQGTTGVNLLS